MSEMRALKLRARDPRDMDVIAALLQDALVPLVNMAYLKRDKRFVMVANRFHWDGADKEAPPSAPAPLPEGEDARFEDAEDEPPFLRVHCGIAFDKVLRVRHQGFDQKEKDQILNLLTIKTEANRITLMFSEGAAIMLEVSEIACHLEDIGEAWPTRWRPAHDEGAGTETAGTEEPKPEEPKSEEQGAESGAD